MGSSSTWAIGEKLQLTAGYFVCHARCEHYPAMPTEELFAWLHYRRAVCGAATVGLDGVRRYILYFSGHLSEAG